MIDDGYDITPEAADRMLLLHRAYLDAPPPDGVDEWDAWTVDPRAGCGRSEPAEQHWLRVERWTRGLDQRDPERGVLRDARHGG